jgi:hypothetical protein
MTPNLSDYNLPDIPPAGFFSMPIRRDVWRRVALAVQVMAKTHHSTFQDIRDLIAEVLGVPSTNNLWPLLADQLPRFGLAITDVIPTVGQGKFGLIRLSDPGKQLAQVLGIKLFDYTGPRVPGYQLGYASDWEDLIEQHQGESQRLHTALLLHFDLTVRRLGGQTQLLPPVGDEYFKPDIRIAFADSINSPIYVEVEGRHHRGKWHKWRTQARYQNFVAVCAKTPARRHRLVRECRSAGVAGIATDLQTLIKNYHAGEISPFWREYWPGRFIDSHLDEKLSRLAIRPSPL